MFANLPLKTKMLAVAAAALVGMLAVGTIGAFSQRSHAYAEREALLRSVVQSTRSQLAYFEKLEKEGKLSREEAQAQARELVRNARYAGTEYIFIFDTAGNSLLLPSAPEKENKPMMDAKDADGVPYVSHLIDAAKKGGDFVHYKFVRLGGTVAADKTSYAELVPQWDWAIGTGMYVDDVAAAFRKELLTSLAIVAALTLGVFGLVVVIGRSVIAQIGGEPGHAVAIMKQVAEGDLRMSVPSAAAGSVLAELNALIGKLRSIVQEITSGADRIATASQEISVTSSTVAEGAHQQSDSAQTMAAAMEELTVSISHISEHAAQTEQHARGAAEHAEAGKEQVQNATMQMRDLAGAVEDANTRIESLSKRAAAVGTIAASIKEIASQTNLLALNAAIEAARAGETGRGFAVVADEVRKLAERTATATVEIETMLGAIQTETGGAVEAMTTASNRVGASVAAAEDSARLLDLITDGATRATNLVSEVADSTREQSTASTSLAQQVEQIAHMVETTSQGMSETAHATQELERVASQLNVVVSRFQC
ncbi:methyl-accepting chemotaxis protein [Uliginosibacterium sp. H3]|uniref:Methyl-accepting chemotaxis protein n=1 Tax=Uliginosibacterium silvisoli TaxID=3114758 RepID=A0ABU6K2T0_9RHOO|nr:methyl-accepting chemotaxis protein [Uliginosibacterium sp. H3]